MNEKMVRRALETEKIHVDGKLDSGFITVFKGIGLKEYRVNALSRRALQAFPMLLMLFSSFFFVLASVKAGTFDGTYDYAYNLNGPNGWETHEVPSGFIVSNGRISSNPSALSGSVDSSGNVRFEGPSPYGGRVAVFTGVIKSDGTGEGTYEDQQGLGGRWVVTRISGSGGLFDIDRIIFTLLGSFSSIGEIFGFSGSTAAAIGVTAVVVPVVVVGSVVSTMRSMKNQKARSRKSKSTPKIKYRRELGYTASQLAPPPDLRSQEIPPPIGVPPTGPSLLGVGVHQGPPPLPSALNLRATWMEGQVRLDWDPPQFDASVYQLDEYIVSRMQYGPTSTAPQKNPIARLYPQNTNWTGDFNQTFRWNTGGDIEGYTVEAVLRRVSSTGHAETIRVSGMAYTPPA